MHYLFEGAQNFHTNDYVELKRLFKKIGYAQNPHTLFIGCCDSRLVPNLITRTLPGEIFVIRNIANIVPIYRQSEEFLATTSAIEYAIKVLNVENIIICGHSNCGGCKAVFADESQTKDIPHTKKWLELMGRVKKQISTIQFKSDFDRDLMTERMNVVEQMNHLLTYPYIEESFHNGKLKIFGWHYIIETGEIFNFNQETGEFENITKG
ncbi:MAG: carbonic anhydrase [Bacteroidales bacterium 36-12]|nr:MAG: carbonic anhydrase [Bacteroidales bacterium 36-12]